MFQSKPFLTLISLNKIAVELQVEFVFRSSKLENRVLGMAVCIYVAAVVVVVWTLSKLVQK